MDTTIQMLHNHSWEAQVYNRPDHFEIKWNSLLFSLYSWIRYHVPAYEAFNGHKMDFYIIARLFTAFFGTALIPLSALFAGRLLNDIQARYRRTAQLAVALWVACSKVFVEHSAYATPDVVLAFFVVLFSWEVLEYISYGKRPKVYSAAVIIGISITIKYPAAILCLPLALAVIYRETRDKKAGKIVGYGLKSAGIILLVAFVIAPNLFTNIEKTYQTFISEARPTHLGADGLGFRGNLEYYANVIISDQSLLSRVLLVAGIISIVFRRRQERLVLLTGIIYWICMSVLSLHWARWGIPMFPFYIILMGIGFGESLQLLSKLIKIRPLSYCGQALVFAIGTVISISVVLSGVCMTVSRRIPDNRLIARRYVDENNITDEESLSEGYTPFIPGYADDCLRHFEFVNDSVRPVIGCATKRYLIMSNSFRGRFFNESERYASQCAVYRAIDEQYEKVYRITADANYAQKADCFENIVSSIKYLASDKKGTGDTIEIYNLHPRIVSVKNVEADQYLAASVEEKGAAITLQEDPYPWVVYGNENGTLTLLSLSSNYALDIEHGDFRGGAKIELWDASGEYPQQFVFVNGDDGYTSIGNHDLAISVIDGAVSLSDWNNNENQKWSIQEAD